MCKLYYIILYTACLWVLIDCQGAGGEREEKGGGGLRDLIKTCTTEGCRNIAYVLLGIVSIFFVIYSFWYCAKRRPATENNTFVNSGRMKREQEMSKARQNVFQSGIYLSRYYQYRKWHGPYEVALTFDSQSMKIKGSGCDKVGKFTVKGSFSLQTRRIDLRITYVPGTGDKAENLGHNVDIQLRENVHSQQFEGTWNVKMKTYHAKNKFKLKFNRVHACEVCPKTTCVIDL